MGKYIVRVEKEAVKDLRKIYKSGNKADISKVEKILQELEETPEIGTGNPEKLKHQLIGFWSRRINKKDRLVYEINDVEVIVIVVSALGHYSDK
ncbi:MAG: Txe/YoeB family addiction module toxin [Bacteroidetes bacterium]|nr:Txe/YoeB family addiction module toxin [Bacteroidota bacterium]